MENNAYIMETVKLAGRIILENGGETYRAEDTVERLGQALGCEQVDIFAIPSGMFITLHYADGTEGTTINRIRKRTTNLEKVDMANHISRQVAAKEINEKEAWERLKAIRHGENKKMAKIVPLAAGLVSAAFCFLFVGTAIDALVAFVCALLTQWVIKAFERYQMHQVVTNVIGGFICTMIPLLFHYFTGLGLVDAMVAGGIMPLVPGLAMTNAVQDSMRGDFISGVFHAINALLIAALIAAGAIAAQSLFTLLGGL